MTQGIFLSGLLQGPLLLTPRGFSSGAVTILFYDLGLLQLGFKHPTFRLRGKHHCHSSLKLVSALQLSLQEMCEKQKCPLF